MSAAAFVLAINLFIAAIFATAFGVVAAYQRSALGARWLSMAYATGIVTACLEFALPYQTDHRLFSFGIFAGFLFAISGCAIGLAYHYRLPRPWLLMGTVVGGSLLLNLTILDMPRESFLRAMLYQAPYALVQTVAVLVLIRNRRWRPLDVALLALLAFSGVHFLGKPFLAAAIGAGAVPQAYLGSTYAAISQSLGAALLISNGLLMLLIILRDVMADMTARSETDTLSGLLNRRGFEDRGDKALDLARRSGVPTVMVVADLDHFKQINDNFGHAAGDAVIARFAAILAQNAGEYAICGRLGGEEFAVLMSGANLATGRLYAEAVRSALRQVSPEDMGLTRPVTASFGVAQLNTGDTLSDLLRRADAALYQAKTAGRDRVNVAMPGPLRAVPTQSDDPSGHSRVSRG